MSGKIPKDNTNRFTRTHLDLPSARPRHSSLSPSRLRMVPTDQATGPANQVRQPSSERRASSPFRQMGPIRNYFDQQSGAGAQRGRETERRPSRQGTSEAVQRPQARSSSMHDAPRHQSGTTRHVILDGQPRPAPIQPREATSRFEQFMGPKLTGTPTLTQPAAPRAQSPSTQPSTRRTSITPAPTPAPTPPSPKLGSRYEQLIDPKLTGTPTLAPSARGTPSTPASTPAPSTTVRDPGTRPKATQPLALPTTPSSTRITVSSPFYRLTDLDYDGSSQPVPKVIETEPKTNLRSILKKPKATTQAAQAPSDTAQSSVQSTIRNLDKTINKAKHLSNKLSYLEQNRRQTTEQRQEAMTALRRERMQLLSDVPELLILAQRALNQASTREESDDIYNRKMELESLHQSLKAKLPDLPPTEANDKPRVRFSEELHVKPFDKDLPPNKI